MEEAEVYQGIPRWKQVYQSKAFQIFIDVCRIALVVLAVVIIIILIKEIEAVKILSYDICRLCAEKSGAVCFYP